LEFVSLDFCFLHQGKRKEGLAAAKTSKKDKTSTLAPIAAASFCGRSAAKAVKDKAKSGTKLPKTGKFCASK
jgi:hypothetical protein